MKRRVYSKKGFYDNKGVNDTIWIENSHSYLPRIGNDDRGTVIKFWSEFYQKVQPKSDSLSSLIESVPMNSDLMYQQVVFKKLSENRGKSLSDEELRNIQLFIEDSTFSFDEESMYKTVPNVIKIMIKKGQESAKNYLFRSKNLTTEEKESLNVFGQYTLEVLLIHVLSTLFNAVESSSVIRLSTLVDRLDTTVRSQSKLLRMRDDRNAAPDQKRSTLKAGAPKAGAPKAGAPKTKTIKRSSFQFGIELVEFMQKRDLIEITQVGNIDESIRKKEGSFYIAKHQNVSCKFSVSDLPIRFSLPMVCKPEDWKSIREYNQKPRYLSEIRGGYLSSLTGDADERCRLLSSHNLDHFYIELNENYEDLCRIMNKLQSQPFEVNSRFLEYIKENKEILVEHGLLLPNFLSKLKLKNIYETFKNMYYSYNFKKRVRLSTLFKELSQLIQRSSYEQYILKLAIVYEGYRFYLPAFLDFRGRIHTIPLYPL